MHGRCVLQASHIKRKEKSRKMIEIIGVRFKSVGKVYYFSPGEYKLAAGDKVIVETARGVECGEVVLANKMVPEEEVVSPLKPVIRVANYHDYKQI